MDRLDATCEVLGCHPRIWFWGMRIWRGRMTHLGAADRDILAYDIARIGGLCTHHSLMLLGLSTLYLYLCVDLLFLRHEIICVFLCLNDV